MIPERVFFLAEQNIERTPIFLTGLGTSPYKKKLGFSERYKKVFFIFPFDKNRVPIYMGGRRGEGVPQGTRVGSARATISPEDSISIGRVSIIHTPPTQWVVPRPLMEGTCRVQRIA